MVLGTKSGVVEVWNYILSLYSYESTIDLKKPIAQLNYNSDLQQISVHFEDNSFAVVSNSRGFGFELEAEFSLNSKNSIVKLDKESRYAVVAGDKIEVIDITDKKVIAELKHGTKVNDVAIIPTKNHIISASDDKTIKVWDITEKGKEALSVASTGNVQNLVLSQDLSYFAAIGDDGYVRVYTLYN